MKLLDVEFDAQLFATGELSGIQAVVRGFRKLICDTGISYLYQLEYGNAITEHRFETIFNEEYIPKGSVGGSGMFFKAISASNLPYQNHTLPLPSVESHDAVLGKELGIILDDMSSIVGFCTVSNIQTLPKG